MYKIRSEKYGCPLFINDDLSLILLPCIFSHSLVATKQTYYLSQRPSEHIINEHFVKEEFDLRDVGNTTIYIILTRLESFLHWVEVYSKTSKKLSLDNHQAIPNELINYYINEILIEQKGVSQSGVFQHVMALNAYFNYLAVNNFSNNKRLLIWPKFRETARNNTKKRSVVKYITPKLRSIMYQNTSCKRDELLLRTGGEMGCRSKENLGFLLNDFKVGHKVHKGLKSLFHEMNADKDKQIFEYYLQGKFSKAIRYSGGQSRTLYFHKDLLIRFEDYYKNERPKSKEITFFLNNDINNNGKPISPCRASRTFAEIRDRVIEKQKRGELDPDGQKLEKGHTHHTLRHSFATNKFYDYAQEKNIRIDDVTTTSQVYLAVAALMGHSLNGKSAPQTTKRYIRSCHIMLQFDEAIEQI